MITKQFYVSPECGCVVFQETMVLCTSLNPLMDNTDTIEWIV